MDYCGYECYFNADNRKDQSMKIFYRGLKLGQL